MADTANQIGATEMTEGRSPHRTPRYSALELNSALRQGEIISDVVQWLASPTADKPEVLKIEHEFCVIATQDCDLEQDFNARLAEPPRPQNYISEVLLLRAFPSEKADENNIKDGGLRKRIQKHDHPKLQLMEQVPAEDDLSGIGVPELVVDMRQIFSIRREELYRQIESGVDPAKRRARLVSPYREHLQIKLAFHLGRVGLPEPHMSV